MPALLIDITRLLDRLLHGRLPTGVDRVSLEYVRHLGEGAHALVRFGGRWLRLPLAPSARLFAALLAWDGERAGAIRRQVGWAYLLGGRERVSGHCLLNSGHSGLDDPRYAREVRRHGLRPLYFLHDLIPLTHPEYCRPGEAAKHAVRLHTMLCTAEGLLLNSAATAQSLHDHAERVGWAVPPTLIVPLAPACLPPPSAEPPLRQPYFVVLGTIEPRKNHLLLLQLWRQLAQELGGDCPRLILIGQRGWECEQVVDLLERCEWVRAHVQEIPACGDAELSSWLRHARALLFPSFAEGYGLPLVEALALGTPVIASDLPAFREVAGDIPDFLSPLDGLGWRDALLDYLHPASGRRAAQLARLRHFEVAGWQAHFSRVRSFMAGLALG